MKSQGKVSSFFNFNEQPGASITHREAAFWSAEAENLVPNKVSRERILFEPGRCPIKICSCMRMNSIRGSGLAWLWEGETWETSLYETLALIIWHLRAESCACGNNLRPSYAVKDRKLLSVDSFSLERSFYLPASEFVFSLVILRNFRPLYPHYRGLRRAREADDFSRPNPQIISQKAWSIIRSWQAGSM